MYNTNSPIKFKSAVLCNDMKVLNKAALAEGLNTKTKIKQKINRKNK